jgi:membrane protein implicated in regulation of membrane protease activity
MKLNEKIGHTLSVIGPGFWALCGGIIGLYLFGLVMGVFAPGELLGWTILVVVLAVLLAMHLRRERRALEAREPETMHALASARERRGF